MYFGSAAHTGHAWNPPERGKADLQFRWKQSLSANARNLEAVGQTAIPAFLAVRLLGSDCRQWVRPGELMMMTSKRPLGMSIGAGLYGACTR